MTISLESCWAKMDRAKEHRDLLDRHIWNIFSLEMNRPRLGITFDGRTGQHVLSITHVPDLALFLKRAGLHLGDIAHNFRSALDHLTYQLALWHTGGRVSRPKRVQFPIADNPSHFASARGDALREVHPHHQAIIERFQPYHPISEGPSIGPDVHTLVILRDLDNADKYRPLTPILVAPTSLTAYRGHVRTIVQAGIAQTPDWTRTTTPLAPGAMIIRATLPPNVSVALTETAGSITPDLALPEGWPIDYIIDRVGALLVRVLAEFQLQAEPGR